MEGKLDKAINHLRPNQVEFSHSLRLKGTNLQVDSDNYQGNLKRLLMQNKEEHEVCRYYVEGDLLTWWTTKPWEYAEGSDSLRHTTLMVFGVVRPSTTTYPSGGVFGWATSVHDPTEEDLMGEDGI
ncbi:uncharacterized protein BO96DRAFT_426047 [Aspergillus niger CBS 101883]|uniref:uncharacterized protein n=1 Tax=Aspergillus lacticoffeatus (strain CBS 101883) TaxID=1450533 RepID=UPI000D7F5A31|nr:uncharacterized protein BO96DRAFT_426047 [Aspergillus niger CBS 101883]PYH53152.1 hypothetical protein BO96DRAFT_426047 [Aspergillus niger CBS 101883]